MRAEWQRFIESLDRRVEFLHADELKACYGLKGLSLPVVFEKRDEKLETLVDATSISACRSIDELEQTIMRKLSRVEEFS